MNVALMCRTVLQLALLHDEFPAILEGGPLVVGLLPYSGQITIKREILRLRMYTHHLLMLYTKAKAQLFKWNLLREYGSTQHQGSSGHAERKARKP